MDKPVKAPKDHLSEISLSEEQKEYLHRVVQTIETDKSSLIEKVNMVRAIRRLMLSNLKDKLQIVCREMELLNEAVELIREDSIEE